MFAVSVGQTMALHQYFQRAFETGMRIKTSLTAAIYSKSLKLSNEGRASKSTGDIVNYMAVDTQRLQDLTQYGQQLWSAPYQITLCMISLYQLVGFSMLAGVGAMIFMIPINGLIARLMKKLQKEQMKNKVCHSLSMFLCWVSILLIATLNPISWIAILLSHAAWDNVNFFRVLPLTLFSPPLWVPVSPGRLFDDTF